MHWVSQELDGYTSSSDLPDYRIVSGNARADLTNGVRYETLDVTNIALPSGTPEHAWDRLRRIYFTDAVKESEAIQGRDDLVRTLDHDLKHYIEQNARAASGYWVRSAYIPIAPGAVAGLLSSIRSRLLQYVFRLRKDFPEFDQQPTSSHAPSAAQLGQVFQVTIGQGSAVTFGSGSAHAQSIIQQVIAGDLDSLKKYLQEMGVEQTDLEALDAVIVEVQPADLDEEQSAIRRWIANVAEKAGAGGKELAKTATRELILLSVRYFFGGVTGQGD